MAVSFINNASIAAGAGISTTKLGAGAVLQVVQGTTTTGTTVAFGSAFTASNLSASITPTSSSSKVLILINGQMYISASTGEPQATVYKNNTTNILGGSNFMTDTFSSAGALVSNVMCLYLDSPATTSSTTYTFYFKNTTAGNATFPVNSGTATIILMEIAA